MIARAADLPEYDHPDFAVDDGEGRTLKLFLARWNLGGEMIDQEIWAYDREDAQHRVEVMRMSLVLVGQLKAVIE